LSLRLVGILVLLALGPLLLAACGGSEEEKVSATPTKQAQARTATRVATLTPVPPTAMPTPAPESSVKLVFAYSPGCPHCAYQKPIITEFEQRHPEVDVIWVRYADLNSEQRRLVEGTSGHPVMVFHSGDHIRQVVGETSIDVLEEEYEVFQGQVGKTEKSKTKTGSYIICR